VIKIEADAAVLFSPIRILSRKSAETGIIMSEWQAITSNILGLL
jgi:hypothetical protein